MNTVTVTELRKIFTEQGVKGASKWKREDFNSSIIAAEFAAYAELEARYQAEREAEIQAIEVESSPAPRVETKLGFCTECGRKEDFRGSQLCEPCREYAEDENMHSDGDHENAEWTPALADERNGCRVCHPELDRRTQKANRTGSPKAGMVVHAKGSVEDKVATVRTAAEARGMKVLVDASDNGEVRLVAKSLALEILLSWDKGGRYDYPGSRLVEQGKVARKVRNVSEALRFIG